MDSIKDFLTIAAVIFSAGGAWSLVKFLKEAVKELKENDTKLTAILNAHETRLSILEDRATRRKR